MYIGIHDLVTPRPCFVIIRQDIMGKNEELSIEAASPSTESSADQEGKLDGSAKSRSCSIADSDAATPESAYTLID